MSAIEPCRAPVFISPMQAGGHEQVRACQFRATWRQELSQLGTPKETRPTFRCEAHRLDPTECPQVQGSAHNEAGWAK